jgi:hypothetical protein
MRTRNSQRKIPIGSAVRLAIAAVENDRRPVDISVAGVDPAPGALILGTLLLFGLPCGLDRLQLGRTCAKEKGE